MKTKHLSMLVTVLALLTAVTWYVKRPATPPGQDPRIGQAIITRDTLVAARSITLKDNGEEVTLAVGDGGKSWVVREYHDFPVDFSKLSSLTNSLRNAHIVRLVTRSPERMKRLDFGTTAIEINTGGAVSDLDLDIGKVSDAGGRFVRFGDEKMAFLADLNIYPDATPKSWARSLLLEFESSDVARLRVEFPDSNASLEIARSAPTSTWEVASGQANGGVNLNALNSLINRFTNIRFTETAAVDSDESAAALEHARHLSIELFNGTLYQIALGRRPAPPPEESPPEDPVAPPPPESAAGPVYIAIESNRKDDPINALMAMRSFEIGPYVFTALPADTHALLEPAPEEEIEIDSENESPETGGRSPDSSQS